MADNIQVYDKNRNAVTMATKDIGGVEFSKVMVVNSSGTILEFDDLAEIGVVLHEHNGHGDIHFHVENVSASAEYILIDLSDTTNYPHTEGVVVHIDSLNYSIDPDTNATYEINFYYLENVDGSNGDQHMWYSFSGSKSAGNAIREQVNWNGDGPIMKSGTGGTKASSNMISLNDPDYSSADLYKSTHDVTAANTPCGSGDVMIEIVRTAGTFDVHVNIAYHTHAAGHP